MDSHKGKPMYWHRHTIVSTVCLPYTDRHTVLRSRSAATQAQLKLIYWPCGASRSFFFISFDTILFLSFSLLIICHLSIHLFPPLSFLSLFLPPCAALVFPDKEKTVIFINLGGWGWNQKLSEEEVLLGVSKVGGWGVLWRKPPQRYWSQSLLRNQSKDLGFLIYAVM